MPIRPADPDVARFRPVARISVLDQQGRLASGKQRIAPSSGTQSHGTGTGARGRVDDGFATRLEQTVEDDRPDDSAAYSSQGRRGWFRQMLERIDDLFGGPSVLDAAQAGGPTPGEANAAATVFEGDAAEPGEDLWQRFNRWPSRIIAAYTGADEAPAPTFTAVL